MALKRPASPSKTRTWIILVVVFAATILGMARYGRSLREIMSVLQSESTILGTPANSRHHHPRSTTVPAARNCEEFWERRTEESTCFHIDNVCNWKDGWFYYGPNNRGDGGGHDDRGASYYQPTATLLGTTFEDMMMLNWNYLNDFHLDERIQVNISSTTTRAHALSLQRRITSSPSRRTTR